jgi:DNA-binding transcriptional ArsR family regulator
MKKSGEAKVDKASSFDDTKNMKPTTASGRLAALGHETRLAIFRLLVQAGSDGISAGVICEKLAIPAPTLSFHLAHLSRVGLIRGRQESRFIFYAADYAAMDDLLAYLTDNCCQGAQCLPLTTARVVTRKRARASSSR